MVAEWWFKSTCGHNSSKKGFRRFFPNVLDDTRKFGSVPIMELEPVAIRSGVYSPCRFESYTLRLPEQNWVLMCDGIGKRNCRRGLVETDNIDDQIVHSCVVQIHATSILYLHLVWHYCNSSGRWKMYGW
jgi:hypothetical protein